MADLDPAPPEKVALELVKGPLLNALRELEFKSRQLPTEQDFHFYSNFQEFKDPVSKLQSRVVSLLNQLGLLKEVRSQPSAFPAELDEDYDWLVGVQDDFLERVDASVDKFHLERKDQSNRQQELNAFETSSKSKLSRKASRSGITEDIKSGDVKVARSKDKSTLRSPIPFHIPSIPRPQDKFDDAVDNSNTPFKHHAAKGRNDQNSQASASRETAQTSGGSLPVSSMSVVEQHARKLGHKDAAQSTHPLEEELTTMAYVEGLLDTVKIRKYESLDDTPFTLVNTLKGLKEMAAKLRIAEEMAVDLENHHYRSYQGFVCLMQVSTRSEDFIVDTLDLRSQIGPCLGDIFSDPTIRKVMHGADHDIVWLQRDFGIYVCNLFDTGQAARVLQLQGFGLAFLLEHFCGVHADKRYQLADWRIRPLPSEMIKYAREDTHYLLYVYDMLKQQLLDARAHVKADEDDPVLQVYKRSRDICLLLYSKEIFTETTYQQLYGLQEKNFRPEQHAVLAGLYAWRDQMARKEDESTGYVLPNHLLFQLASEMPDNVRKLQSFVKGPHSLVGRNASAITELICQAKEKALMDYQDAHPVCKGDKQMRVSLTQEEIVRDKVGGEINKIDHSVLILKTSTQVASKSPDGEEKKTEMHVVQAENLVIRSKTSTSLVGAPGGNNSGLETTGSGKADVLLQIATDAVPEVRSESGQLKLTPEVPTGPVVVSRKPSSSFFSGGPRKIPSVPLPSSLVSTAKDFAETRELKHPSTGASVPISNLPCSGDQEMAEALTVDHGVSKPLDEGQGSDQAKERIVSEKYPAIETAAGSIDNQSGGAVSLTMEDAVDSSSDMPFTVPDISPLQVSLAKAGNNPEINVSVPLANKSMIPASESTPVVLGKKAPSKLGFLLGGQGRLRQIDQDEPAKELDQEQARIKIQEIESSMVLPFHLPFPDLSRLKAQPPATGEAKIITSIPEGKMDNCNEKLEEETGRPFDEGRLDRPGCSTASHEQDVLMFEPEDGVDGANGEIDRVMSNGTFTGKVQQKPNKHRMWWPPAADGPSMGQGRDSNSSDPGPPDAHLDQILDNRDDDKKSQLPLSLSEMHRTSKRGKKSGKHPDLSDGNSSQEVPVRDMGLGGHGHGGGNKKQRREKSSSVGDTEVKRMVSTDRVDVRSFDYREARTVMGLDNLYTGKAEEDTEGTSSRGRGRGSKKGSTTKVGIPLSKSMFDPLRRAREEPRPEGIQPGQRRQVFPQTGNRTAVFKK